MRQVGSAGAHVADLLSVAASDNTAAGPPELLTTAATRRFQDAAEATSLALTSRTFAAGDYLVIEVGFRKASTSTSTTVTLRFGDSAATDFAHTDALTTDLNPWVEFERDDPHPAGLRRAQPGRGRGRHARRGLRRGHDGAAPGGGRRRRGPLGARGHRRPGLLQVGTRCRSA